MSKYPCSDKPINTDREKGLPPAVLPFEIATIKPTEPSVAKRLADFAEECKRSLQPQVEQIGKKFKRVTKCIVRPEIRKGQRFLTVTFEIQGHRGVSKLTKGKAAVEKACEYLGSFMMPSDDFESLSTEELQEKFIQESVRPSLRRFRDFSEVVNIEVVTSGNIAEQDRQSMKQIYKQKNRCLIEISLGAGEQIRTNLRVLQNTTNTYLRQLDPTHSDRCDVMRVDGRLFPFPIRSLYTKQMETEHTRMQAHITYSNGLKQTINYLANQKKSDRPSYRLPSRNFTSKLKTATHEFLYVWSALEHLESGARRRIIFKFGITSAALSENEVDLLHLEQAIRKRITDYAKAHSMTISEVQIELISKPEPLKGGKTTASRFETFLKNQDNNKLLCDRSTQGYSSSATELMLPDYHNQIEVKEHILHLAKTYFPTIQFEELLDRY